MAARNGEEPFLLLLPSHTRGKRRSVDARPEVMNDMDKSTNVLVLGIAKQ
jgi:hypothetical protein